MENPVIPVLDNPADTVIGAPAPSLDNSNEGTLGAPAPAPAPDQAPPASSSSSRTKPLSMTESAIRQRAARKERREARARRNPAKRTDRPVITPRLSMFKTESGDIDFSRTNQETIEQLARAVKTPEARRRLGLDAGAGESASSSPSAPPASTWGDTTPVLLECGNLLILKLAEHQFKLTQAEAATLYMGRKPELRAKVEQKGTAALDKRFPGGLGENQDLFDIGALLFTFFSESLLIIQEMRKQPGTVHPFPAAAGVDQGA